MASVAGAGAQGGVQPGGAAERAGSMLRAARLVVLDFDGPITRLLPDPEYLELAAEAVGLVADSGVEIPPQVMSLTDHGAVLVEVGRRWPELLTRVEAHCEAAERHAAGIRPPADGALQLIRSLAAAGTVVAVVTNNGAACVQSFLHRFGLRDLVSSVHGRIPGRADLLKPSPVMLRDAASVACVPPVYAVMVGDSVTDTVAAAHAGMASIGMTTDIDREQAMVAAGAAAVVDSTAALLAAHSRRC